jgi:GTP-binding protein Era
MSFFSGFIGFLGPPNSGKSTLFNAILGRKISIVSPRPQTTRNRITGVLNGPDYQMVLVDTPGIHRASSPLHRSMVDSALAACREVDLLVIVSEVNNIKGEAMTPILSEARASRRPCLLAINKIDLLSPPSLLPLIAYAKELHPFEAIIPLSARKGDGVSDLVDEMRKRLREGPKFFPEDMVTDQPEAFQASEIIREKIFFATRQELPYACAVTVEAMEWRESNSLLFIRAGIHVERDRQKAILIGEKGRTIKAIGTMAREDLERLMGSRVFLELTVKVTKNWTKDPKSLRKLGY